MFESGTNPQSERPFQAVNELSFDREQIIELAKKDLNMLASLCMPTVVTHMFPATHIALWSLLIEKVGIYGVFRLLLGLPRGHAKTTLIKLFVIYCVLFTDIQFILIICATGPKATNFMQDVVSMLSEPNIIELFGDWRASVEEDNKDQKIFNFRGRNIIIAAFGQGSVRGLNIKNIRPEVIVMDDVQDKENAQSETESNKLLDFIQSTVMKLRSPHRCLFVYIGNAYKVAKGCVCILERIRQNPLWVSIVTGAILKDGRPLWPELHPLDSILEELQNDINMGTPDVFFSEVMNDTETNLTALVDVTKIPISPYEDETLKSMCSGKFIIIDVATNKIGADDTTIGVHGIYPGVGRGLNDDKLVKKVVLEELMAGSLSPKQTIEESFKLAFKHGVTVIAVESVAYQSTLLFWFDEVSKELEISGIYFVPVMPHGKKAARILGYIKQLLGGDVYMAYGVREEVVRQIVDLKPNRANQRDDILDMASYWQQVMEKYEHLIAFPHTIEGQEYSAAKVVNDNCSF
jgi:hypothetical protein